MTVENDYATAIANCLVMGLTIKHQFFIQQEAKQKPITPCMWNFSNTLSKLLQGILIGSSRCCGGLVRVIALVLVLQESFENWSYKFIK